MLTFNSHIFYILSNVITHNCDYPEEKTCIALYVDMVKQGSTIFDIKSVFAKRLIKTIKKDKSLVYAEWSTNKVEQLFIFSVFAKDAQLDKFVTQTGTNKAIVSLSPDGLHETKIERCIETIWNAIVRLLFEEIGMV